MTDENPQSPDALDEIYALIDKDRAAAARAAQARFHNDMETAIATISGIGSIAGARVLADSRVASANVLINAELAASRLLAEAQNKASTVVGEVPAGPKHVVEEALLDIGRVTTLRLITAARESVEKIQRDAEAAIQTLQKTGDTAIREIQALAADVSEQTKRNAELAAAKLKEYRKHAHTPDDAVSDGEDVANIIVVAAEEASLRLQKVTETTLAKLKAMTDEACSAVSGAALAAEKKIEDGRERALARLRETLQSYH